MSLVLGPVLRHVGETTASVWVQLDRAAMVSVLGCAAPTFEVCGYHYAIVPVIGLEPDTRYPNEVLVDVTGDDRIERGRRTDAHE